MKKCAILLSGILNKNNMDNITEYIINANPDYEFDFFMSFWDSSFKIIYTNHPTLSEILSNSYPVDVESVSGIYKPKAFMKCSLEHFYNFYYNNNLDSMFANQPYYMKDKHLCYRNSSQLYMCENVINVFEDYTREQNQHYDIVIRYRYDLFTSKPILLNQYDVSTTIYGINRANCFPDWIFIGNHQNMSRFMHIFSSLLNRNILPGIPEAMFSHQAQRFCTMNYSIEDTFVLDR